MINIEDQEDKAFRPTNDYIFRRIFGSIGNEEITKGLISSILNEQIETVELNESPILEKDLKDDKLGILDIKAKLNTNTICNIEMQVADENNIEKRILYYWSKLYEGEIKKSQNYNVLKRTISILIADFELKGISKIEKFHTKWNIREEEYTKIILTNALEIHIIELPKLIKMLEQNKIKEKSKLMLWSMFLLNPGKLEEKDMNDNKDIKEAKEELTKIQQDERERELARLRMKHKMDQEAIKELGHIEGKKEQQIQIAKNMLKLNIDIDTIMKSTELTKDELLEIKTNG